MRRAKLVIFARRPAWGVGKRRLASEVGDLAALRFQRYAIDDLVRRLGRDRRWRTWVAISPDRPRGWVKGSAAAPQGAGDLGERLVRVIRALPVGPTVVIGADAPAVQPRDIAAAFRALGSCDAVFGPAPDGGYWLAGVRCASLAATAFANVRWSSAFALADTLANLRGRTVRLLRIVEDVDDKASHERFGQTRPRRLRAARTSPDGPAARAPL
jgi:hypothetical protein